MQITPTPISFRLSLALLLVLSVGVGATDSSAGVPYRVIKSFGQAETSGASPAAAVIQGVDGALYGTASAGGMLAKGIVFRFAPNESTFVVLHHFGTVSGDGSDPEGRVIQAADGLLYGTTASGGGSSSGGVVFRVTTNGTGYQVLHQFGEVAGDGSYPYAGLVEGSDGALYGTTSGGGKNGMGTIYKLNRDSTNLLILHNFGDGQTPYSQVCEGPGGFLYGTTCYGGTNAVSAGIIFRIAKDGTAFSLLRSFSGAADDGRNPTVGLLLGTDGAFYGTTSAGGNSAAGTVFRVNPDGTGFTILHHFAGKPNDGSNPQASLVEGSDGALYGTTGEGGNANAGTVYKLGKDGGNYTVLKKFVSFPDGLRPYAPLVQSTSGEFYGTTYSGTPFSVGSIFKISGDGSGYVTCWNFATSGVDGKAPKTGVLEASDRWFYGTTEIGGQMNYGTVFRMRQDGSDYSIIHHFGLTTSDGRKPNARLVEASDGLMYGTTTAGGSNNVGTVFKMNKDGSGYALLKVFGTGGVDGKSPYAGLVSGSDQVLYGTTTAGGSSNAGTIFRLNRDGSDYAILLNFGQTSATGTSPWAPLIEGSDGFLYGTASAGGTNNRGNIFRINRDGSSFLVLHQFQGIPEIDGLGPAAPLIEASDGALYGTTQAGPNGYYGTAFGLNKDGSAYRVLHFFGAYEGMNPESPLVEGNDGALYGAAQNGLGFHGSLFRLKKDGGDFGILHTFYGMGDGMNPAGEIIKASDGTFYGTTWSGGHLSSGIVFQFFPPQTPVMSLVQAVGQTRQVIFSGMSGFNYELFRSYDLVNWSSVGQTTMPLSGISTNVDATDSSQTIYYRAAWLP